MCETCISIFFSFLDRYSDLQRGWKQQKVDVALYMDSFASSVFSAMALVRRHPEASVVLAEYELYRLRKKDFSRN